MMRKLFLYTMFIFIFNSFTVNVFALSISTKYNGKGELYLSAKVLEEYTKYIIPKSTTRFIPYLFYITEDEKNSYMVSSRSSLVRAKNFAGGGAVARNKKKCELKFDQKCYLFSNSRMIVWNNGTNPLNYKESILKDRILYNELVIRLKELGFIETKEKKAAKEKKLAEDKAAKEKKLAEDKAAKEKKLAEDKAAKEKKLAEDKAAKEKKLAEEKKEKDKIKSKEKMLSDLNKWWKSF